MENPVNLVKLKQNIPASKYDNAVIFFNKGLLPEAEKLLNDLLRKNNNDYDVLNFLGVINLNLKNFQEASACFEKVILLCPHHKDAYYNLGLSCQELKQYDQALESYNKVLEFDFNHLDAINNSGIIYLKQQDYQSAEACFSYCLSLKPGNPSVINNLGNIYLALDKMEDAVSCYKEALELDPRNALYHYNLGSAYLQLGKDELAVLHFEDAVKIKPDYDEAINNLAIIYLKKSDFRKAQEYLVKTNNNKYSKAALHTNDGCSNLQKGYVSNAIECMDAALSYQPENPDIHYNKSHALLLSGKFEEGWAEYEWRIKRDGSQYVELLKPLTNETEIAGKRILVRDEQGLGDSIHFVRYLKLLKEKGAYTIFKCSNKVISLFSGLKYVDELIPRQTDDQDIAYDYEIYLLSLPKYFNTSIENIPADVPYINADPEYLAKWNNVIKKNSSFKIGIVWAGNPNHTNDEKRSCSLRDFLPLFDIKGVEFYSLQKGEPAGQVKDLLYPIIEIERESNIFSDTAAIIQNLDLVISVDTSVAHLAGAMGKEVWLLLCSIPDWRWMLERCDTPWYPTIKLFRQKTGDDWLSVFEDVRNELKNKVLKISGEEISIPCRNDNSSGKSINIDYPVYLGLSKGENYGWGIVSKYINKELLKKIKTINLNEHKDLLTEGHLPGKVIRTLINRDLDPLYEVTGDVNIGLAVFENELTDESINNSKYYDLILAGSTWCYNKLKDRGINNTDILLQGIDPEMFYPGEKMGNDNLFVIFSGGKFEYRKGQDLVLKAVKILQQKYSNIILVNAWYNLWPEVIITMGSSKHINFELKGTSWNEFMNNLYIINDMDPKRIITLPLVPNDKLRELYLKSDIGLFPNRCEGGTNLVLMEYMACGRPVVASYNSGHKDVLTAANSLMLEEQREVKLYFDNKLEADWSEPFVDEIVEKIEFAYHNRDVIKALGQQAGQDMKEFTWEKTSDNLLRFIS